MRRVRWNDGYIFTLQRIDIVKIRRFDIYGRSEDHENGNLYDVDEVHEKVKEALDDETKDDIVSNICAIFGIEMPRND